MVKLTQEKKYEILLIVLEKGQSFPPHSSLRNTLLIMLEGNVKFNINSERYTLGKNQIFEFPAKINHDVLANGNSKFLIIR
ncbi:cupin domain-containing protein [Constantimarinum furrinae]